MSDRRYFEFDYDQEIVIEYNRTGECNQCGACCWAQIKYTYSGKAEDSNIGESTTERGIWHGIYEDERFYLTSTISIKPGNEIPCRQLNNGLCSMHSEKSYKENNQPICDIWPTNPTEIVLFPKCSYSFSEMARWTFPEYGL